MKQYNMDSIYYRVKRDDKWQNVCFSDCTSEELAELTKDYTAEQWKRVALHFAEKLYELGEFLESEGYELREQE